MSILLLPLKYLEPTEDSAALLKEYGRCWREVFMCRTFRSHGEPMDFRAWVREQCTEPIFLGAKQEGIESEK